MWYFYVLEHQFNAISKYIDGPISSTVSYQFGDDGQGNIDFPAITICFDSFKWVMWAGMSQKCSTNYLLTFSEALRMCTNEDNSQTTTTTSCGGMFGCMFNEEENKTYPFDKIKDLLEASKIFAITDILSGFYFGQEGLNGSIRADKSSMHDKVRLQLLTEHWKPTLHFNRGFCYTFDPKNLPRSFPVLYNEELLSIYLKFEVSWTLSLHAS